VASFWASFGFKFFRKKTVVHYKVTSMYIFIPAWARGVVDIAPVCHLGDPGSTLSQAKFLQWLMALLKPTQYSIPCTSVKTGWGDS
jgi:hypothetical protein